MGEPMSESDRAIGAAIRAARTAAGVTLEALAEAIGCSKAQVSLMETGRRRVSAERAAAIEAALGVDDGRLVETVQWQRTPPTVRARVHQSAAKSEHLVEAMRRALAEGRPIEDLRRLVDASVANVDAPLPLSRRIPVINKVAAGYPVEFTDLDYPVRVADEYIACPDVADPNAFAARVVGDSMAPSYSEGEIVVFSPAAATDSGTDCFVRLLPDNETTFKRVYLEDDGRRVRLQPLNPAYGSRVVDAEEIGGMYAAVYVMRRVGGG